MGAGKVWRSRGCAGARLAELESVLADAKLDPAKHSALLGPLIDIPIRHDRLPHLSSEEIPRKQLAAMVE